MAGLDKQSVAYVRKLKRQLADDTEHIFILGGDDKRLVLWVAKKSGIAAAAALTKHVSFNKRIAMARLGDPFNKNVKMVSGSFKLSTNGRELCLQVIKKAGLGKSDVKAMARELKKHLNLHNVTLKTTAGKTDKVQQETPIVDDTNSTDAPRQLSEEKRDKYVNFIAEMKKNSKYKSPSFPKKPEALTEDELDKTLRSFTKLKAAGYPLTRADLTFEEHVQKIYQSRRDANEANETIHILKDLVNQWHNNEVDQINQVIERAKNAKTQQEYAKSIDEISLKKAVFKEMKTTLKGMDIDVKLKSYNNMYKHLLESLENKKTDLKKQLARLTRLLTNEEVDVSVGKEWAEKQIEEAKEKVQNLSPEKAAEIVSNAYVNLKENEEVKDALSTLVRESAAKMGEMAVAEVATGGGNSVWEASKKVFGFLDQGIGQIAKLTAECQTWNNEVKSTLTGMVREELTQKGLELKLEYLKKQIPNSIAAKALFEAEIARIQFQNRSTLKTYKKRLKAFDNRYKELKKLQKKMEKEMKTSNISTNESWYKDSIPTKVEKVKQQLDIGRKSIEDLQDKINVYDTMMQSVLNNEKTNQSKKDVNEHQSNSPVYDTIVSAGSQFGEMFSKAKENFEQFFGEEGFTIETGRDKLFEFLKEPPTFDFSQWKADLKSWFDDITSMTDTIKSTTDLWAKRWKIASDEKMWPKIKEFVSGWPEESRKILADSNLNLDTQTGSETYINFIRESTKKIKEYRQTVSEMNSYRSILKTNLANYKQTLSDQKILLSKNHQVETDDYKENKKAWEHQKSEMLAAENLMPKNVETIQNLITISHDNFENKKRQMETEFRECQDKYTQQLKLVENQLIECQRIHDTTFSEGGQNYQIIKTHEDKLLELELELEDALETYALEHHRETADDNLSDAPT